jgi:hypothetical protein
MENMIMGRPPRETPDYDQLTEDTRQWIVKMDCVRVSWKEWNEEKGKEDDLTQVNGYFVKFSSEDPNKPVWAKAFPDLDIDLNREDWHQVMKRCRAQNILLAYHHGRGWYLGDAKDVGETIASRMNHSTTHLNNSVVEIGLARYNAPNKLMSGYKKYVNGQSTLAATITGVTRLLKGVGIAVKKVIVSDYLPASTTDED